MTRLWRTPRRRAAQLMRLGLVVYFLVFLAWILPNHALSHEQANLTDRVTCSPSSNLDHSAHNPDKCQICRTHGQLDAWPVYASLVVRYADAATYSVQQHQPTSLAPTGDLSPRAPPQLG